jgi:hypothetical protein
LLVTQQSFDAQVMKCCLSTFNPKATHNQNKCALTGKGDP